MAEFCAHFAMLLLRVKLDDDIRDNRSIASRASRFIMRRPIKTMQSYFISLDVRFQNQIADLITGHIKLEQADATPTLKDYVAPTSDAFAYVMSLSPVGIGHPSLTREIGRRLGAALIAFDCAVDWHRDQSNSDFNPLQNVSQVDQSYEFSIQQLTSARRTLTETLEKRRGSLKTEHDSICLSVLRGRIESITDRITTRHAFPTVTWIKPRRSTKGRLIRYGDCDCGIGQCAGADCSDCNGTFDCFDWCANCYCPGEDKSTRKKRSKPNEPPTTR